VEALAPYFENAATTAAFNWDDADTLNNLYYKAVDPSDYGDLGAFFDWQSSTAALSVAKIITRHIGEIDDCVTLLEASALA
jgi:hypothetical protein